MTVVADLSLAIPSGGVPARANLVDKYCGPKETDGTRALFSFPLNSCGSTVKVLRMLIMYSCPSQTAFTYALVSPAQQRVRDLRKRDFLQPEVACSEKPSRLQQWSWQVASTLLVIKSSWTSHKANSLSLSCRVTMQCVYSVAGLHRLFSVYKFESDTVGVGRIVHSAHSTEGRWFDDKLNQSIY